MILARGLVRRFGHKAAVDRLDLSIPSGGIVALVGPNGAGKTTFLNLVLGLLEPTEGSVQVLGHSPRPLPAEIAAMVQAVGDRHEPPGSMRLDRLIDLQADAVPQFDRRAALRLLLDRDLTTSARFGTLSKGQRRWVLATLALASRPRVLLLDEPADGLDPAARRDLYDELRRFVNEHGATVVAASHVLSDLERVADDLIVLREGRVVMHDALETLRDEVRELHLACGEPTPEWLGSFRVLSQRQDGQMSRQWIRLGDDRADALERADGYPGVRHVNLESLYFALTGTGPDGQSDLPTTWETLPCD
jgi:ABC-2 type transport system ATP-binding protein